jgi:hypothetical protein
MTRFLQCRPGYKVWLDNEHNEWLVRLADGSTTNASQISDIVLEPYHQVVARWTIHSELR